MVLLKASNIVTAPCRKSIHIVDFSARSRGIKISDRDPLGVRRSARCGRRAMAIRPPTGVNRCELRGRCFVNFSQKGTKPGRIDRLLARNARHFPAERLVNFSSCRFALIRAPAPARYRRFIKLVMGERVPRTASAPRWFHRINMHKQCRSIHKQIT